MALSSSPLLAALLVLTAFSGLLGGRGAHGLSPPKSRRAAAATVGPDSGGGEGGGERSRADFLRSLAVSSGAFVAAGSAAAADSSLSPPPALAADKPPAAPLKPKLLNLPDSDLRSIIESDMTERSFLVSADLTREVYDESAMFTDEIDTYPIEKWITGTQKLFVSEGSKVKLIGDVDVTPSKVEFMFDEELMFRIPFRPVVTLSGRVVLERDEGTGLITSYREFWDQDVNSVLRTAKVRDGADGTLRPFPILGGLIAGK